MAVNTVDAKNSVTIVRDSQIERPELWLDVCIIGDRYEQNAFAEMLVPARCSKKELPEDADVVIFTGGVDVNPALYGEDAHPTTIFDTRRDEADMIVYQQCIDQGIPMFGVCRGAQFLHVMNGGRLFQDVDGHQGDHTMYDLKERRVIDKVSSVHHQMCIPNPDGGMINLATASKSMKRWKNDKEFQTGSGNDVEAFFYRDTCCFGVQGHPEYRGYTLYTRWVLHRMNEFFLENGDLELRGTVRRLRPDFIEMRNKQWAEDAAKTVVIN